MMTLLTGGSKCGKSAFAERILAAFSGQKYYIAAMQPYGSDAAEIIARHHKMRESKGFFTIECYTGLQNLSLPNGCGVLLECLGNLCANEMFRDTGIFDPVEPICAGIRNLQGIASEVVIVTNEVGDDGVTYPTETMQYIRNLAKINAFAAGCADNVIECVAGIPVLVKGELPCCIR